MSWKNSVPSLHIKGNWNDPCVMVLPDYPYQEEADLFSKAAVFILQIMPERKHHLQKETIRIPNKIIP
jgi:hypothetical protein